MDERKPQTGDRRFACQCGAHYYDGGTALAHTMLGHEVVLERYSVGDWTYHPVPVADYLIEQLMERESGEGVEAFVSRIEKMAGKAQRETLGMQRN